MVSLSASPVTSFSGFGATAGSPSVAEVVCISKDCHNNVRRKRRGFEESDEECISIGYLNGRRTIHEASKWIRLIRLPLYSAAIRRATVQL